MNSTYVPLNLCCNGEAGHTRICSKVPLTENRNWRKGEERGEMLKSF